MVNAAKPAAHCSFAGYERPTLDVPANSFRKKGKRLNKEMKNFYLWIKQKHFLDDH
mgnify:CR=1 FL=1